MPLPYSLLLVGVVGIGEKHPDGGSTDEEGNKRENRPKRDQGPLCYEEERNK